MRLFLLVAEIHCGKINLPVRDILHKAPQTYNLQDNFLILFSCYNCIFLLHTINIT